MNSSAHSLALAEHLASGRSDREAGAKQRTNATDANRLINKSYYLEGINLLQSVESMGTQSLQASVIIPAYNEENIIALTLEEVFRKTKGITTEVIVVDDHSADLTYLTAEEAGAKTVRLSYTHGFGGAARIGISKATLQNVVLFDSSGEFDPDEIVNGLNLLVKTNSDFAFPYYFTYRSLSHKFGASIIKLIMKLLFNLNVEGDIPSTFFCAKRSALNALELSSNDFILTTEVLLKANAKGFRIVEFQVKTRKRFWTDSRSPIRKLITASRYLSVILRNSNLEVSNGN